MGAVDFLLNRGKVAEDTVVEAPAFSLTKVLTVAAPVITAAVALIADKVDKIPFGATHVTVLTVAVLGFVAIAGSADVLARSIAAQAAANAGSRSVKTGIVRFDVPIAARLTSNPKKAAEHEDIKLLGASDAQPPQYLIAHEDGTLTWEETAKITFA